MVLYWEDWENLMEVVQPLFLLSRELRQWSGLAAVFKGHVFIALHRLF